LFDNGGKQMNATVQESRYEATMFNRYSRIKVTPVAGPIGAQIECEEDITSLDPRTVAEIHKAWLDHLVVVFRGRTLTDPELLRVGRFFGELQESPPTAVHQQAARPDPYISVISNVVENGIPLGSLGNDEAIWHTDMSNTPVPPAASILTSLEVPQGGGETGFINMYEALCTLPADLLSQIQGRTIYHDGGRNSAGQRRRHAISTSHPIIRTHPETGRNALYLGRRRDSRIDGLGDDESDALLDALWAHTVAQPAWHHEWRVGDTLIWDNRCVIHHRNSFDGGARRIMHRTQTLGTAPAFSAAALSEAHQRSRLGASAHA
jgi:taurine dioxygenase